MKFSAFDDVFEEESQLFLVNLPEGEFYRKTGPRFCIHSALVEVRCLFSYIIRVRLVPAPDSPQTKEILFSTNEEASNVRHNQILVPASFFGVGRTTGRSVGLSVARSVGRFGLTSVKGGVGWLRCV